MKNILFVTLIFLLVPWSLVAQNYKKSWSEGKLTWDDFRESQEGKSMEFKYSVITNTKKQKFGDTVVLWNYVDSYMDKKRSWVHPECKTAENLRYSQILFDIVEIHRRRLQKELDEITSILDIETKFRNASSSSLEEIRKFQAETDSGKNEAKIEYWERKVSNELLFVPERKMPDVKVGSFGYGMHVGLGFGGFTGSIAKHFTPNFNFIYGFDLAYKRSMFYLSATLAVAKVKKDYFASRNLYENQSVNFSVFDFSYGYAIIDGKKLKLAPFAGFGVTEYITKNQDDMDEMLRLVDRNLIFGLNADYKWRTKIRLMPYIFSTAGEKVEYSIRARLYIAKANYTTNLNGYSINLTVGLCGFGNFLRNK